MISAYRIEPLHSSHDRGNINCGVPALDRYFIEQVTQDIRRRVTACFVLVEKATGQVAGYYTLSASSIALTGLPIALSKQLPRYPSVPVARLGRLAISSARQGQRLGSAMTSDAAIRAIRSEVAVFALVVDAKNEAATSFYSHLGFQTLSTSGREMVLPLKHLAKHFSETSG